MNVTTPTVQADLSPMVLEPTLEYIDHLDQLLDQHFKHTYLVQPSLNRQLVSFQANKTRPVYRWYRYKEGFSAGLVEYLIAKYGITKGKILDPFAGSGTTLFVASELGIDSDGIELLPIGQEIIATKQLVESELRQEDVAELQQWVKTRPWVAAERKVKVPELRITRGAYSDANLDRIEKYLETIRHVRTPIKAILRFALLCVLESVSYTRKDGQYLRWDFRSGRKQGQKPFDKGEIRDFDEAICEKLQEVVNDLSSSPLQPSLFGNGFGKTGRIHLLKGSSLEIMPRLPDREYDGIITSPPYCNRYDYTRTYALELALLGVNEGELVKLRQEMLSCTVENRAKDLLALNPHWQTAIDVANDLELLQTILNYLDVQKRSGTLNNNGIPRMVRGYFYEMACIIAESARVLKPNAPLLMVNDNVRYAGASISVDMLLSAIAERFGFTIENILVLPGGKGNSSQQMGEHGREALRKCVYVWRKQ